MMKKVLYAFLAACVLAGCTTSSPVEPALKAQILCMTADATSITPSSAELNGTAAIQNASSKSAEVYFYYSTDESSASFGTKVSAGKIAGTGGDFSCELNDLEPSSNYYYVAAVAIDGQESLGSVRSFTTKAAPLTMTGAVDNISVTSATLYGYANLPSDMTGEVKIGIIFSTDADPTFQNSERLSANELDGNNRYACKATSLASCTKYYYRSYLTRDKLNYYGEVKSFTTADFTVSLTTEDATAITNFKATLNGELKVESIEELSKRVYFKYGKNAETLKTDGWTVSASLAGDSFSYTLTGLTPNTTYYYVAYSEVAGRYEYYGEVKYFTTADFTVSLTTEDATAITNFKATLNGELKVESIEELSKRVYFKYGKNAETLKTDGRTVSASLAGDSFSYTLTDLTPNTTCYYVAYSEVEGRETSGEVKSFMTFDYQIPESVDLGLSVKWASFNVGAMFPEDYGVYFAWGETEPKDEYSWGNYKWSFGSEDTLTKYNFNPECGIVDKLNTLQFKDDAATKNWGNLWRMPTEDEFEELMNNCKWIWTTYNGMAGFKVVSKVGGYTDVAIFLMIESDYSADGCGWTPFYWSSSMKYRYYQGCRALGIHFDHQLKSERSDALRCYGLLVRPVKDK